MFFFFYCYALPAWNMDFRYVKTWIILLYSFLEFFCNKTKFIERIRFVKENQDTTQQCIAYYLPHLATLGTTLNTDIFNVKNTICKLHACLEVPTLNWNITLNWNLSVSWQSTSPLNPMFANHHTFLILWYIVSHIGNKIYRCKHA